MKRKRARKTKTTTSALDRQVEGPGKFAAKAEKRRQRQGHQPCPQGCDYCVQSRTAPAKLLGEGTLEQVAMALCPQELKGRVTCS